MRIQQDERVGVPIDELVAVDRDPREDQDCLEHQVARRTEEACEPLGFATEPVRPERRVQGRVFGVVAEMVLIAHGFLPR